MCRATYLRKHRLKQKLFARGVIIDAFPNHWIVRCGPRTRFTIQIGDVSPYQQRDMTAMVVGAVVEFNISEGEFIDDLEVIDPRGAS